MSSAVHSPKPYGIPPKTKTSPKVVAAAILGFLAPALYLTLGYLTSNEGRQMFDGMHPVLQVFLGALFTSAAVWLGSYMRRDGLREAGARAQAGPDATGTFRP